MEKMNIVKKMIEDLNKITEYYTWVSSIGTKQISKQHYTERALSYNTLLSNLYGGQAFNSFPSDIDLYIELIAVNGFDKLDF